MVKSRRGTRPKGRLTGTYGKVKTNLILHRKKGHWFVSLFVGDKSIS